RRRIRMPQYATVRLCRSVRCELIHAPEGLPGLGPHRSESRRPPVSKRHRARFVALVDLLARHHPELDLDVIRVGRVLVDGRVVTNPHARVRADASLRVVPERRLRGAVKLGSALDAFGVDVTGRIAVDVGASAGGFTTVLL